MLYCLLHVTRDLMAMTHHLENLQSRLWRCHSLQPNALLQPSHRFLSCDLVKRNANYDRPTIHQSFSPRLLIGCFHSHQRKAFDRELDGKQWIKITLKPFVFSLLPLPRILHTLETIWTRTSIELNCFTSADKGNIGRKKETRAYKSSASGVSSTVLKSQSRSIITCFPSVTFSRSQQSDCYSYHLFTRWGQFSSFRPLWQWPLPTTSTWETARTSHPRPISIGTG